jgi:hypothetical protein
MEGPLLIWEQLWPHTGNPNSELFQKFEIKLLLDTLTRWDKLSVCYPFAARETNQLVMTFDFDICAFFGRGEPALPNFLR